ncbi:MAG: ABC transporter ATP-binding protein [Cytophagales bacterium]|nr:ABC transporter ATP-binding protein [Armatimonadota bacterium]
MTLSVSPADSLPQVIVAEHLVKRYGIGDTSPLAVDDLCLSVAAGELFGFLGENGAGKTTTIKMLTGLIPPTRGAARIGGFDLRDDPLRAKALMGYIPDNPFLYEKLTGREFLEFIGDLYRVPGTPVRRARIHDLLTLFDLDTKAESLIGGYSRGMRQKIALAAALLHDPKALFLDEPTVGLDPKSTRRLQDVLRAVAAQGTAVFLSTHVMEVAAGLCDRIGIMHKGRLVAIGTPSELTEGGRRTLEEVFLSLTGGAGEQEEVARLLSHNLSTDS